MAPEPRFSCHMGVKIALFGAFWIALAQEPVTDVRAHYEAARAAQKAGNLEKAAAEYREVVRLAPEIAEAHFNLGLLCYTQGRIEESVRELEQAERLSPGLRGADLYLGIGYARLNQPRRAVPLLEKAVAQGPRSKEARSWLATALWDAGRRQQAVVELERAAVVFPGDLDVLFLLGESYRKAASAMLDELIASAPESSLVQQVYAETYAGQGRWDRAAKHYRRLLEKAPAYEGARAGLAAAQLGETKPAAPELARFLATLPAAPATPARALYANGDYAGAVRLLRQIAGRDRSATYLLARCYERLAVSELDRILTVDANSYRAHQLRAQIAEAQGRQEQALEEYRAVEAMRPAQAGLHYSIGHLLFMSGRREEALVEIEKELKLNPTHAEANAEAGSIYVMRHEEAAGIPYLERALRLKPDLPEARRYLGRGYLQIGRLREAEVQLKLALAADRDGAAHYILGTVYRQMGRQEDAKKVLDVARRIKAERLEETAAPGEDTQ